MSERVDVADRMRALADAPWVARGDAATQSALREGADEVERLTAVARGAQYREREALAVVAVLRARLDGALDERDGVGTVRQWRGCHRCGRCFLLADTEAVPGHGVTVDGVDRDCGTKGEGR